MHHCEWLFFACLFTSYNPPLAIEMLDLQTLQYAASSEMSLFCSHGCWVSQNDWYLQLYFFLFVGVDTQGPDKDLFLPRSSISQMKFKINSKINSPTDWIILSAMFCLLPFQCDKRHLALKNFRKLLELSLFGRFTLAGHLAGGERYGGRKWWPAAGDHQWGEKGQNVGRLPPKAGGLATLCAYISIYS